MQAIKRERESVLSVALDITPDFRLSAQGVYGFSSFFLKEKNLAKQLMFF